MRPELKALHTRIRMQAYQARDFSQIPQWVVENTRDPIDIDRPWSFAGHEYQPEIMADTAPIIDAQKCSQVGASEFWVRMMLAMMGISKKITIIYTLPTSAFAARFSSGRIDPVIIDSPVLKSMVDKNLNNTRQKQIGRSMLYIAGTVGQSSAISVPAQALFHDEVDFSNPKNLTTYQSRIGHSKEGEALTRRFSTPTVFGYGINATFVKGSQAYYHCRCFSCREMVAIDYFTDVEIPGLDKPMREFEKEDLHTAAVRIDQAFFRCPNCRNPMDEAWFRDPANRQWVHRYPDRKDHHSYQILPIDVPTINPLRRTLAQIADYESKKDWVNFKVGVPFEDAASTFLLDLIHTMAVSVPAARVPDATTEKVTSRTHVIGVDVGKVCWVTLATPNAQGKFDVVYQERLRIDGENTAGKRIMQLFHLFSCVAGVVDAGPDISLAAYLTHEGKGRFFACQYTTPAKYSKNLDIIQDRNEETRILKVHRSGAFDELVRIFNQGTARLNKMSPEYELAKLHLKAMKRIEYKDEADGDVIVRWENVDDDHYAHSINYAFIAFLLANVKVEVNVIPYMPNVLKVQLKSGDDDANRKWPASFGL